MSKSKKSVKKEQVFSPGFTSSVKNRDQPGKTQSGVAPAPAANVPRTLAGYDPTPYLNHPMRNRQTSPETKKRDWYDYVKNGDEFEEAWIGVQDRMHDQLLERLCVSMPYLRDAPFYNLNAVVLKKRPSITSLPMFMPAGPLHLLCKNVTASTYEKISTSVPTAAGRWLSTKYDTFIDEKHNGLEKEIAVHLEGIFRVINQEIAPNTVQVNKQTLNAIWSFDEKAMLEDWAKSPNLPRLDSSFFKNQGDDTKTQPSTDSDPVVKRPLDLQWSLESQNPPVVKYVRKKKRSLKDKVNEMRLRSLYVIHELICAELVTITIRIGKHLSAFKPRRFLFNKRGFPIGFNMTKYKIDSNGFLKKICDIRGHDCIDYGWNTAGNIPWPGIPLDPKIVGGNLEEPEERSAQYDSSILRGNLPGILPLEDPNRTRDLNSMLMEQRLNEGATSQDFPDEQSKSTGEEAEADDENVTQDLDELLKLHGMENVNLDTDPED